MNTINTISDLPSEAKRTALDVCKHESINPDKCIFVHDGQKPDEDGNYYFELLENGNKTGWGYFTAWKVFD